MLVERDHRGAHEERGEGERARRPSSRSAACAASTGGRRSRRRARCAGPRATPRPGCGPSPAGSRAAAPAARGRASSSVAVCGSRRRGGAHVGRGHPTAAARSRRPTPRSTPSSLASLRTGGAACTARAPRLAFWRRWTVHVAVERRRNAGWWCRRGRGCRRGRCRRRGRARGGWRRRGSRSPTSAPRRTTVPGLGHRELDLGLVGLHVRDDLVAGARGRPPRPPTARSRPRPCPRRGRAGGRAGSRDGGVRHRACASSAAAMRGDVGPAPVLDQRHGAGDVVPGDAAGSAPPATRTPPPASWRRPRRRTRR